MMQALRKAISQAIFKEEAATTLPLGDVAWSEPSLIYTANDFEKYNPDSLIGVKGFAIYKKMMLDEQVKAVTKFKRDAITSRDYTFELNHEMYGISEEEAKRRIDLSYAILDELKGSWQDALNGVMSAMYNGFSMSEKLFKQITFNGLTYWGLDQLKLKPYDTFRFNVDVFSNINSVTQKLSGKEQTLTLEKFVHFVFNPDVDEHYGQSELRECYRAWFNKDTIIKFRNIWLERHAGGFHWAKVTEGTLMPGSKEYTELQNVLNGIQTSTGIIVPKNIEMNGSYPSNNVAFKEAIEDQDTAIARGLLVPNLLGVSPQGDVGSYSQSTNQLEAFFWTLEADTNRLDDTLNEQVFRQLGEANFGDGIYPRYKSKPASKSKMIELVNTWKDLVSSGAVTHNQRDELYLRELLDMPVGEADEEDDKTATRPDTALNGAQVSSMVNVIEKMATGVIPKESALAILIAAFPLSNAEATAMIESVEVKEPVDVEDKNSEGNTEDSNDGDTNSDSNEDDLGGGDKPVIEETVVGRGLITVSAFTKAQKRVDFAVIDKTSETIIDDHTNNVAKVMDLIVADLIAKGKSGGGLDKDIEDNISELIVNSKLKRKLNKTISTMLSEGYSVGEKHANNEISRAKGEDYGRKVDYKRLKFIANDYFKVTSMKAAGALSDSAVGTIENIILNGVRYDWAWERVETEIYASFASQGMISPEQAREALGEALNVENPDAHLRTLVRTNTFDAINVGRYDYFTDPGLDDFVTGFEYSAILDGRTTQICKHLEEDNAGDHSTEWYAQNLEYRPPNHYNCRSLLIPVTAVDDDFVEGPEPSQQPQRGFGGSV